MSEIFKSEFQRYRLWAMLAVVAILGIFSFISRLKPFLQPDQGQTALTYMAFITASAVFGFVQLLLHRRANHWTYLIQRPLAASKIYLGIALAGVAIVALVVLAPWFIMVGGLDTFSATVVDIRHYTWGFFLFFCALTAYFVGSLTALNPSKGSILLAVILVWLMDTTPPNDFAQFAPMIIAVAILLTLNIISFKPDLSLYLHKPWAITLMVLPMTMALTFGLAMSTTIYYHVPKFIMGTHPDNNPVDGTVSYLWSLEAPEQMAYALEGSTHPRTANYIRQAELADFSYVNALEWTYPRRGQLYTMDLQYALSPAGVSSTWQFSHDEMLLVGYNKSENKPAGALGRNGFIDSLDAATEADRFTEVPVMSGDRYIMTKETLYQLDFVDRHMSVKLQLPAGEEFITPAQIREDFVAMVTDKRMMIFDPRVLSDDYDVAEPDFLVDHPQSVDKFRFVDTYRLVDGFLILYRSNHMFGFDKPGTYVIHAKLDGEAELIHARTYDIYRHPGWIRHFFEMVSPAMTTFHDAFFSFNRPGGAPDTQLENILNGSYPANIYWIGGLLMVLSPIVVFFMCRLHRLTATLTITWVILCGVLSLPALIAFFLMNPFRIEKPLET